MVGAQVLDERGLRGIKEMQNTECGTRNDAESEQLSAKEIRERFEKVKREMGLG